jgi:FtsP/CotA-like multicopper oxidase with cupredoxin domain
MAASSAASKVGHLIAGPVDHEFAHGLRAQVWAIHGGTPGPTIEAIEGDRVRMYVTNRLPEPTTVHCTASSSDGMDGVAGLNQRPIAPGETFAYEFHATHAGTFMYHPHYDEMTQIRLGMGRHADRAPEAPAGPPRGPRLRADDPRVEAQRRSEAARPQRDDDFNVLTFNSNRSRDAAVLVGRGERVRIRLGTSARWSTPNPPPRLNFKVTATDGGFVLRRRSARHDRAGTCRQHRVIEFVPEEPGDWGMHCHMTHHG